jgi:hypothetical protein
MKSPIPPQIRGEPYFEQSQLDDKRWNAMAVSGYGFSRHHPTV